MKKHTILSTPLFYYLGVVGIATLLRIPYLGVFPPGEVSIFITRLATALVSIVSILIFMLLVHKLFGKTNVTVTSGLVLTMMPWYIEQSRVYSPPMLGLTALLGGVLCYLYLRKPLLRMTGLAVSLAIFYIVYPDFWLFSQKFQLPGIFNYLHNLFKLISVEFLFYKNDSFWWGGLRNWGALQPTFIPLFIIGLFEIAKKIKFTHIRFTFPFLIIWFIAAANPKFPEGREFFLITPYLGLIVSFGVIKVFEQYKISKIITKLLIIAYLLFITYEYTLFAHFYVKHYSLRIENEIPHEKRDF